MRKSSSCRLAAFVTFVFLVMSMLSCSFVLPTNKSPDADSVPASDLVPVAGATSSANPSLSGMFYSAEGAAQRELLIHEMEIDVSLIPGFAETRMEIAFLNPTDERIEGELLFDLPPGAIVTGYALDINGFMIPGSLAANPVANRAYEARVRGDIDPGIAEITRENTFRNRIYPIPAEGIRRIGIEFISPVNEDIEYVLPLNTATPVGDFSLQVEQVSNRRTARVTIPDLENMAIRERRGITSVTAAETLISGRLKIEPRGLSEQIIQEHPNGELFALTSFDQSSFASANLSPKSVRIYWDRSLSHQNQKSEEVAVVSSLVRQLSDADIELVTFAGPNEQEQRLINADNVSEALELTYHGGTDLESVLTSEQAAEPVELCVLVSDGQITQGGFPDTQLPCPLVVLTEAPHADKGVLALLAKRNQGRFIDLTAMETADKTEDVVQRILTPRNSVQAVLVNGEDLTDQSEWHDDGRKLRVVTPVSSANGKIEIRTHAETREVSVSEVIEGSSLGAWWAAQRITAMHSREAPQEERIAFARKYSVAGDDVVFAVFEMLEDYVFNEIPLPKVSGNVIKAMRWEDYSKRVAEYQAEKLEAENNRMDKVISAWEQQMAWYDKIHTLALDSDEQTIPVSDERDTFANMASPGVNADTMMLEDIIVTGRSRSEEAIEPRIEIIPWNPERTYLEELSGLCEDEFRRTYFDLLPIYGDKPAFFLEVADSAFDCGDVDFAMEVAASALESELSNTETQVAVAHRFIRFGDFSAAIGLFQKVAKFDPSRPQPWRDMALAYANRARDGGRPTNERMSDFLQALEHLNIVITQPQSAAYEGIELIALNEANQIVAELAQLGETEHPIDPRLVRLMDSDLRIVITWNRDAVDMDLRVTEPHGEEVYYSNDLSIYGGKLSNDMTDGYGPEEYMIHHAQAGTYRAAIDYFGSDFLNPNGPVISQVEIYRNWGRENQSSATTYNEFISEDEKQYELGEITFEE